MLTLDELNQRFGMGKVARFEKGRGGLARLVVRSPLAQGEVYLYGAHVTDFQPAGQKPVLFLSEKSEFATGKAIRGGVPVIFPWFGPRLEDPSQMHGFVRMQVWEVREVAQTSEGGVRAVFEIASNGQTRAIWGHDFELTFAVTFGQSLRMELTVKNTSSEQWSFGEALHSYFAVGDVRQVAVDGLGSATYVEKFSGPGHLKQEPQVLEMVGPTDRVYLGTQATCIVHDRANKRKITIAKTNSNSTVVWNPWSDAIGKFSDLDPQAWTRFLCVETCNVWDFAPVLAAGQSHALGATISVQPD
jgi:glucose-6-phosphate 1-epimerase